MFNAIILGLIQGLTEFLPVSSSAHIIVFEKLLGFKDDAGFAAAIHLATAFAAIIYFRKEIWSILKSFIKFNDSSDELTQSRKLGVNVILATIPAAILGFIVTKLGIDEYFSSLAAIGLSAIFFGQLLGFAHKYNQSSPKELSKTTAFLIGASQIVAAIFPGASRSGVTLTTSFYFKLEKEFAAKFAFLIAIPITAMAGLNEIVLKNSVTFDGNFIIAFIVAFVSGLFGIYFLLYFVRRAGIKWIVLYRVIFGIVVLTYNLVISK
jgi:undecaprenyl-diphosphatase